MFYYVYNDVYDIVQLASPEFAGRVRDLRLVNARYAQVLCT